MLRGERVLLDGNRYKVADDFNSPSPVSRILVMIGGAGERKTLRMVAQYADESNLICERSDIPRKLDALAEHCEHLGRDRRRSRSRGSALTLGIDGFTINLPLNGHISGRVALLGEGAAKAVTG